jgi:DNA polymerase V
MDQVRTNAQVAGNLRNVGIRLLGQTHGFPLELFAVSFRGVCDLTTMDAGEQQRRFSEIEVREVWGIGRRISERLRVHGISTVADLRAADARRLREHFTVVLERTVRELQGEPCIDIEDVPPAKQQIIASRTFSAPAYDADQMAESIREYMGRAATKLRQQKGVAGAIGVWIETNRFREQDSQHSGSRTIALPMATDDTGMLTIWAVALMRRIFRPGHRYWKSGVMLLDLSSKGAEQLSLFDAPVPLTEHKRSEVMRVMDQANSKWGKGTIGIGSAGLQGSRGWSMKRELLSPRYTTRWDELPRVRS